MRKLALSVLTLSLVAAACSGSDSTTDKTLATEATTTTVLVTTTEATTTTTTLPPTTTTTLSPDEIAQAELEADTKLIKAMWREYSDGWWDGIQSGLETQARFNHPMLECSVEDYKAAFDWIEGDRVEVIIDASTVERDDGWATTDSAGDKRTPEGRIYIMTADIAYNWADAPNELTKAEIHSVVSGGTAFLFIGCDA